MKFNLISTLLCASFGVLLAYLLTLVSNYNTDIATVSFYVVMVVGMVMSFAVRCEDIRKTVNIRTVNIILLAVIITANLVMIPSCIGYKLPIVINALLLLIGITLSRSIYKSK